METKFEISFLALPKFIANRKWLLSMDYIEILELTGNLPPPKSTASFVCLGCERHWTISCASSHQTQRYVLILGHRLLYVQYEPQGWVLQPVFQQVPRTDPLKNISKSYSNPVTKYLITYNQRCAIMLNDTKLNRMWKEFTCAQFPNWIFAELHSGTLSSNQNGCLWINGTKSLTPAPWRFIKWSWKTQKWHKKG